MKWLPLIVLLLVIAAMAGALMKRTERTKKATGVLSPKRPLTDREQAAYFRLRDSLPDRIVLAQVAFSALLTTKDRPTRATFDRKVADFVICSKAFEVIAIVEIDDASHKGRETNDDARDRLLTTAGYRVLRFKQVPDAAELLNALNPSPVLT